MKNKIRIIFAIFLLESPILYPQEIEYKDTPWFSGMPNFTIYDAEDSEFDSYNFFNGKNCIPVEGKKFKRTYSLKEDAQKSSIIQVSRNKRPGIIDYSELNSRILSNASLIINTTPLGMFPDTETRPEINYSLLNENHILFDLVYNPELTLFLRSGMKMGCSVISGLKMLHSQAERAWQIWNDDKF